MDTKLIKIKDCEPYQEAMNAMNDPVEELEGGQKLQKERQEAMDNSENQTKIMGIPFRVRSEPLGS